MSNRPGRTMRAKLGSLVKFGASSQRFGTFVESPAFRKSDNAAQIGISLFVIRRRIHRDMPRAFQGRPFFGYYRLYNPSQ